MTKNYYDILEIPKSASQDEVKKAYRKLSLKYHPDKSGDADVSKFHDISEAFDVLGDEQKRQGYDNPSPFQNVGFQHGGMDNSDIENLFNNIFFSNMRGGPMGGMGGMGGFPMHNMFEEGGPRVQIFQNGVPINVVQKPPNIIKNITISFHQVLNSFTIPVEVERWIIENNLKVFENETVYVTIPEGIDDNEMILLEGKGNIGPRNTKGDIKIFVKIENKTLFERKGLDLYYLKNISLKESLCGFAFDLLYLNEKNYKINNSVGNIIPHDFQKVIPNLGLKRDGHQGNLIIHFKVQFPTQLSIDKVKKLEEIL